MAGRVTGYVLAGGRSSRMGQDKALLELDGETLLARAVAKLRAVCGQVFILGANPAFAAQAPLVPDLHPGCGPMSGLEAALTHSPSDWVLVLPVDLPFLPASMLTQWIKTTLLREEVRIALFTVDGVPQPTLALLNRDLLLYLTSALEQGRFKLYPLLKEAAVALAAQREIAVDTVLVNTVWEGDPGWFANVNTPEEFAAAQSAVASDGQ